MYTRRWFPLLVFFIIGSILYTKFSPYEFTYVIFSFWYALFLTIYLGGEYYFTSKFDTYDFGLNELSFKNKFKTKSISYKNILAYRVEKKIEPEPILILLTEQKPIFISIDRLSNSEYLFSKLEKRFPEIQVNERNVYVSWKKSIGYFESTLKFLLVQLFMILGFLCEMPTQVFKGTSIGDKGGPIVLEEYLPANFKRIKLFELKHHRWTGYELAEGDDVQIAISWAAYKCLQISKQPFIYEFAFLTIDGKVLNTFEEIKKAYLKGKVIFTAVFMGLGGLFFMLIIYAENRHKRKAHPVYVERYKTGLYPKVKPKKYL